MEKMIPITVNDGILGDTQIIKLSNSEQTVKDYFECNLVKKDIEKKFKELRKTIDDLYKPGDKEDLKRVGLSVNYSKSESSYIDQTLLLEKVKELKLNDCIKTIEVVDEEALQLKILDGELDPNELTSCTKTKTTNRLYIKKLK